MTTQMKALEEYILIVTAFFSLLKRVHILASKKDLERKLASERLMRHQKYVAQKSFTIWIRVEFLISTTILQFPCFQRPIINHNVDD